MGLFQLGLIIVATVVALGAQAPSASKSVFLHTLIDPDDLDRERAVRENSKVILKEAGEQTNDYATIIEVSDPHHFWSSMHRNEIQNRVLSYYNELPAVFHEVQLRKIIILPSRFTDGQFSSIFGILNEIRLYIPADSKAVDEELHETQSIDPRPERYLQEFRDWAANESIIEDIAIHEFLHAFHHSHQEVGRELLSFRFYAVYPKAQAERKKALQEAETTIFQETTLACRDFGIEFETLSKPFDPKLIGSLIPIQKKANETLYPALHKITSSYPIPSRFFGDLHALDDPEGKEWFAITGAMVYRYLRRSWPDPRSTGLVREEIDYWKKLYTNNTPIVAAYSNK